MIYFKTKEEIELIRESSLLVGKTLAEVARVIAPGVKTIRLDKLAEDFIRSNGGSPGYNGFPFTLCISVNEQVVHGFPGERVLMEGDIVSVDCGVLMNGFYGDSAYTFAVGEIRPEVLQLLKRTKESLYLGIEMATDGKRVGDIGFAGHGVGQNLHEKPEVPNYGKRGTGVRLREGMVIAIEPMINLGVKNVIQENDGWTIRTADKMPSAHYEHTVAVGAVKAEILSSFLYIEEELTKRGIDLI
jgi:methionyl aminopeptidase